VALLLVAVLGKYDNCFKSFGINKLIAWPVLIITAGIAAVVAQLCLVIIWVLLHKISHVTTPFQNSSGIYGIKDSEA
jgi:hypothetical protein